MPETALFEGSPPTWLIGLAITLVFAVWARWMRAVTPTGAVAGGVVAFAIFLGAGSAGFATVVAVFLMTAFTTQWRRDRKSRFSRAQPDGRDAYQILANLFAAAAVCVAAVFFPDAARRLLPAALAALCEAAADTVSSEVGEGFGARTYLITSLRPVESGVDGGVSIPGTLAGALAAFFTATVGVITGFVNLDWALIACVCGIAGMLFDSLLGATLQRKGLLGNDGVNFSSTIFAADAALLLAWIRS